MIFAPRPINACRRRFTEDEYEALAATGIVATDERVELRDGDVCHKDTGIRRRFNVTEFHAMTYVAGILPEDTSTELLEGEVFLAARISPRHAACSSALNYLFFESLAKRATLNPRNPVRLDVNNELIPDLTLLPRRDRKSQPAHPGPADVLLLVEIADCDVGFAKRRKLPLYARCGIVEVWMFDLPGRCVEVYGEPLAGGYAHPLTVEPDGKLTPVAFPDITIPISEILPAEYWG